MNIYGYYTDSTQNEPVYDPMFSVPCPICNEDLNPEDIRTISLMVPDDSKSYFYRVHRSCHVRLNEKQSGDLDGLLIDAICSTRNTN
jgi:hypothetical protein